MEIYQYLEPLYNDYRKVRVRLREGGYGIVLTLALTLALTLTLPLTLP